MKTIILLFLGGFLLYLAISGDGGLFLSALFGRVWSGGGSRGGGASGGGSRTFG